MFSNGIFGRRPMSTKTEAPPKSRLKRSPSSPAISYTAELNTDVLPVRSNRLFKPRTSSNVDIFSTNSNSSIPKLTMEPSHPTPSFRSFPSNNSSSLSNGGIRPLSASMSSSADAHSQPHGRTLSALSNTSALSTGSGGTVSAANTGGTAAALSAPSPSARSRRGGGGVGGGVGGSSSSETLFEGTLYKRGRYNKAFKERWFVISRRGQWMEYYESRERAQCNGQCLGTIDLALVGRIEAFTVDPSADPDYLPEHIGWSLKQSEKKAFSFCVHSVHRELHLAAINEVDLLKVLHYLDIAVYGGVVKAGWLRKQEGATAISRKWKRRYGVLNEYGQLKWYKDEDRAKYLGFIDIDTLSSVSNGKRSATLFQLDLYTKYGNVWYIGCDEESDRKSWNHHITALLPDHHPMGHVLYSETSFTSSMVMTTPNGLHSNDSDDAIKRIQTVPSNPSHPNHPSHPTHSVHHQHHHHHHPLPPPPPPGPPPPGPSTPDTQRIGVGMSMQSDSQWTLRKKSDSERQSVEMAESAAAAQRERVPQISERIFGRNLVFEAECKSLRKCHSVQRLIQCMHIWNGNGDEERINELLSQNDHFSADYEHILKWHLDERNEFQALYKHILKHIRHVDLQSHRQLTLPHEQQKNTFYVNAMYVIHCYFFGNLV